MSELTSYFKWDSLGNLLFVNDAEGTFKYLSPAPNERASLKLATLEDLFDFLESKYRFAPTSSYDGVSIKL